jgi:hypothetical protein
MVNPPAALMPPDKSGAKGKMNWAISGVLFLLGTVLLFLLASGALASGLAPERLDDPWGVVLSPLWRLDAAGVGALVAGVALVVFGTAIPLWTLETRSRPSSHATPWSTVAIVAFFLNVIVSGLLVIALTLAWRGGAPSATIGHLYTLSALVTIVGSFLAYGLVWQKKPRFLFASALFFHVVVAGVLGAVFVHGISG